MTVERLNPEGLEANPAFAQATIAPAGRTLYIGGQNGTDASGALADDAEEQIAQALRNVLTVIEAAGATTADVAKLTILLHPAVPIEEAFAAAMPVWQAPPTAVTVLRVAGFARPDAVVEIEAVVALG